MPRGPEFSQDIFSTDPSIPPTADTPISFLEQDFNERNRNKNRSSRGVPELHSGATQSDEHEVPIQENVEVELTDLQKNMHVIYGNPTPRRTGNVYAVFDRVPARNHTEAVFRENFNRQQHSILAGHEYPDMPLGEDDD